MLGLWLIKLNGLCLEIEIYEKGEFQESDYEINFGHVEFECLTHMLVEMLGNQLGTRDWNTKAMSFLKIYICKLLAYRWA